MRIRCPMISICVLGIAVRLYAAGTMATFTHEPEDNYRHSNKFFGNQPGSLHPPRIEWAEPYVLGKLKLLIFLPIGASAEAVELKSRIPAEVSLVTMQDHKNWSKPSGEPAYDPVPGPEILTDMASRLLSPAYRYDAIIIGKVKWSAIPPTIRQKIIEKVKAGTSIVFVTPWEVDDDLQKQMALSGPDNPLAREIQASVPLGLLPLDVDREANLPRGFAPRQVGPLEIRTGKLGGGAVVFLDYKDLWVKDKKLTVLQTDPWRHYSASIALTSFVEDDELFYDYYFSILGKALYSLVGKKSGVEIRPQQPIVTVARKSLPGNPVKFVLSSPNRDLRDYAVSCELRDRHNRVILNLTKELSVVSGNGSFAPNLPLLPPGTYIADVWATQRGAVLDWASCGLIVSDTQYLESVAPTKESFDRKEAISGTVKSKTPLPKGLSAVVELWDTYDRLVQTATLPREGKFQFQPIQYPLSRTYKIAAKVLEKDMIVDSKEAWVGLPSNEVDDYQFAMWAEAVNTRANKTRMRQCREYGVTGYYDTTLWMPKELMAESADGLARSNLLAYPYSYGLWGFRIAPDRKFEDTLKEYQTIIYPPRVEAYRRYGTMAYSTCEESYIERKEEAWNNSEALQDYQGYLKEQYGDLGKLNEIWRTQFKGFEEITPISFVEAKTSRQYTRWLEQELHKVDRFNQVQETTDKTIQQLDPGARVSLDCIGGMDFDWPRMAKIIRCGSQYPLEDFGKGKDNLVGTFIGYYHNAMDEWTMRTTPWQYLFQGGTHVTWWPVSYAFTPDLSEPMLCMKQASEECRELESGAGKLLMGSKKRIDPILILWSNTSYYAGILNPLDVSWESARARFVNMLRRIGFDYQCVGAEFVENELVYGENQKVLILPACQSISRKGVERIKAFVQAGGTVIADFPPATLDEYLRPYGAQKSAGEVAFEECPKCKGAKRIEVGNVWQACPTCGGVGKVMKGGAIEAKSILEDVFDLSQKDVKKCGKGYGLYLNGSPDNKEEWGGIRKSLVEYAGLRGDVEVQDVAGNLRTDVRSYVFDNGRGVFLGVIPDRILSDPPGEDLVVKLARKCQVYDVRRKQYLGETDTVRTGILPTEAKLLAFLPERIEGIKVSLSKETCKPGDVLVLRGALLPASLKDSHMTVQIEVTRGNAAQPAYTKNIAFQGAFDYPIPLALNQEKGQYSIRVTEVITGYTQRISFTVT